MAFALAVLTAGCGSSGAKDRIPAAREVTESNTAAETKGTANETATGIIDSTDVQPDSPQNSETSSAGSNKNKAGENGQLLQSASVDLNGDGESEQVEALQVIVGGEAGNTGEIEGRLKVRSGQEESSITFCRKNDAMSGVLTEMQFEDLDGDGAKDVFIIIPDSGASFSYSTYFIYSFKKNRSYSFTSDSELADFINGFSFKRNNGNKLSLLNSNYGFSADLTIEDDSGQQSSEDYMSEYEHRAWIEPVSVDIGEDSRLSLAKSPDGAKEIKVPLPIFGLATVDMIGELDMYFSVDSNFSPVLKHFDVLDFNGTKKVKAGSCDVK